ncbi:hypothetical protein RRF57_001190 [Xylaria bambusicola]|uniref:Uncharacterized protein n=1 Tax=Xylaria bambusicola TaxID=326684 RepID=A0AAN7UQ72_9PEZI
MSDKNPIQKPTDLPKDQPVKDDKEKDQGKASGSLDWLVEAANYEPPKQPPKSSGDWMKDDGKIV